MIRRLSVFQTLHGHVLDFVEDIGDMDSLGARLLARITAQTGPEHVAFENGIAETRDGRMDDLVRCEPQGHGRVRSALDHRAGYRAGRAGEARGITLAPGGESELLPEPRVSLLNVQNPVLKVDFFAGLLKRLTYGREGFFITCFVQIFAS